MKRFARFLRDPLLHFLAIGGAIYLLFIATTGSDRGSAESPANVIVIGPAQVDLLKASFESVWLRPPSDDELQAITDEFIREEIYYREALALGLDRNDAVIRQRLRLKMEFLTDTGADLLEPSAGELEAYYTANEQDYRSDPRLSFVQVYLGDAADSDAIAEALQILRAENASGQTELALGELTRLPAQLVLASPDAIDSVFGPGFFEQLEELPAGTWDGPVVSTYGTHLVRVLETVPASTPPLEEVRDAVLRDWSAAKLLEIRERFYTQLRDRYVVERHDANGVIAEDP